MNQIYFTILKFCYSPWDTGLHIRALTNYPCHLTLFHTNSPPWRHRTTRMFRGILEPWGAYWCFVAYTAVPQIEAGDTYFHTFYMPSWQEGERRWWTTRGMVGATVSPSCTAIIEYTHPGGYPREITLLPSAPGDLCTINNGVGAPCPNHYLNVDEDPPDEDSTYIYHLVYWGTQWKEDLYNIPTLALGNIDQVTFFNRIKSLGTRSGTRVFSISFKTHGTTFRSVPQSNPPTWTDHSWLHTTNPATGNPWTQTEIDTLQIGTRLGSVQGVGWQQYGLCTQVKIVVKRGICVPIALPGPYP